MIGDFLIWCAGSDTNVLANCEDSVRIKHIGIGSLVLIPAFLACVSMSYALSTLSKVGHNPYIYLSGGFAWGLMIFAFDRFVVSTHKKQQKNYEEFRNFNFYLRLILAVILGIAISHPLVLLYFDGSIQEQLSIDYIDKIKQEEKSYDGDVISLNSKLKTMQNFQADIDALISAEQSGIKIHNSAGYSSGISGISKRVFNLQHRSDSVGREIKKEEERVKGRIETRSQLKNKSQESIHQSKSNDYLAKERALRELELKDPSVGLTERMIFLVFLCVDIVPLLFKTFAPFSMYDKILVDDINILRNVKTDSRVRSLQKAYDRIIAVYNARKNLEEPFDYKKYLDRLSQEYSFSRNLMLGFGLGVVISVFFYFNGTVNPSSGQLFSLATLLTILISVVSNFATDLIKFIVNQINQNP